jgi:protein TonB
VAIDSLRPIGGVLAEAVVPAPRLRGWAAAALALAVHGAVLGGASLVEGEGAISAARPVPDRVVELFEPPPPPPPAKETPPPPPPPAPAMALARAAKAPSPAARAPAPPPATAAAAKPPPAQAGAVIAAPASADAVDFDSFDIVTGTGASYAGGVTSSAGTHTVAVHTRDVDPAAPPGPAAPRLARGIALPDREWDCPWPSFARSRGDEGGEAIIRVVVGPDGRVSSGEVIAEPERGLGRAALDCARRIRFEPARNDHGDAIASLSPPIRVRFTR